MEHFWERPPKNLEKHLADLTIEIRLDLWLEGGKGNENGIELALFTGVISEVVSGYFS